jgi:hypothetical protein
VRTYRAPASACNTCPLKTRCTDSTQGRQVRRSFRAYVHPPAAIRGVAERQGLRIAFAHRGWFWQSVVLERAS